ncbi:MAG TPA: hypothetical protein VMS09_00490 [Paenibacillus sp.]|uniref:hypothetical protein n=1 Tax=Paenibacillus sp. TaxID=58172 RepID=UPI0028D71A06|nr:hypothetical protein [Paenibacillus sp.]HUC90485.1 hypothetical protein [Paenibacillus sp.]
MTNVYQSVVEYIDKYGQSNKEIRITCEPGKRPTIGDFIGAFRQWGLEMELSDLTTMTFKPKNPMSTTVISLRIIRTVQIT